MTITVESPDQSGDIALNAPLHLASLQQPQILFVVACATTRLVRQPAVFKRRVLEFAS